MVYTIKQLAELAGTSVRTLHYYDEIGLLKPESRGANGYRQYGEQAIVRLQQIMFFRELDFSLEEIKTIISSPGFDVLEALQSHKVLLEKRKKRIDELLATVGKTIKNINFPRPYGRGFNLIQTSFALHLFYLVLLCTPESRRHLFQQLTRNTLLTILHPFPNILASRTGIFASNFAPYSVL